MERVRKLWRLRTESVVTERFRNTNLHKEVTRKRLGEIDPAKSPANSRFKWRNCLERAEDTRLSKQRCIICPKREENLEAQKNDDSINLKP
jgi:hypothetical protein